MSGNSHHLNSTLTSCFCASPVLWILANRTPCKPETGNLCNDCFLLSQGPEWGQPSCGRPEDLRKRVLVITCEVKEIPGAPIQFREKVPGVKYIATGYQRSPSPGVTVGRKMILSSSTDLGVSYSMFVLTSFLTWYRGGSGKQSLHLALMLTVWTTVGKLLCLFEPQHRCPFNRTIVPTSIMNWFMRAWYLVVVFITFS